MNRRLFLTGAGSASAYVATRGLTGKKLYAQSGGGPDSNLVNAAITNNSTTTANCWTGVFSGDDWRNLTSIHAAIRSDVLNKGLDSAFVASAGQVGNLDPGVIDVQQLASLIQIYQPAFQLSDMQAYINLIPKDPASLNNAMVGLLNKGLSGHLTGVISQCMTMATYADQKAAGGGNEPQARPNFFVPQPQPPGNAPKPFYNCQVDGALSFGLATAFLVIGIMAAPEVAVLALAFWGPLSFWGGAAAGVWAAGHVVACNF